MRLSKNRRLPSTLVALMLAVGCSSSSETANESSRAEDDPAAAAPDSHVGDARASWASQLQQMSEAMQLTGDEQAKLKDAFNQRSVMLREFQETSGKKLRELESKIKQAIKEKSLTQLRALMAEAKPLREKLTELLDDREHGVMSVLSPERQTQWLGNQLVSRFRKLTESIDFSTDQTEKIKQLAQQAAAAARQESNPSAAGFLKLQKLVEQQVLQPAQKKAYDKLKRANPWTSLFK